MGRFAVYLGIFSLVVSTLVVPVPEEVALLGAGWLAHRGEAAFWGAFAAAWLAVAIGDTVAYLVGRLLLARLLCSKWGARLVAPEKRRWAEQLVARHGWRAILLGRFLVALRGPVYLAIGASRYPLPKFLAINHSVALFEVGLVVWLGYQFGQRAEMVGVVRWIDVAVVAFALVAFTAPLFFGRWLRRRPQRA